MMIWLQMMQRAHRCFLNGTANSRQAEYRSALNSREVEYVDKDKDSEVMFNSKQNTVQIILSKLDWILSLEIHY